MSVRSFRPVIAVVTVAAAALSCYLVSLRVATERASLEDVETKIVLAQRDIRTLQTEIGTRGRLEQLERWNVKVLALSAPKADQFLDGGYQLARLARPSDEVHLDAPVVLASAPKPRPLPSLTDDDADVSSVATDTPHRADRRNDGPASMMHVASYGLAAGANAAAPRGSIVAPPTSSSKTVRNRASHDLPVATADAKGSTHHGPALTGSSREKATH
ncbi:MAG: hypothetical protein ABR588_04175 [Sphingomicrobium sp.]|nr:hypothetical protein [Sphingomonadales bacterium]